MVVEKFIKIYFKRLKDPHLWNLDLDVRFFLTALEGLVTPDFHVGRKLIVLHDGPPRNPDLAAAVHRPHHLHHDLHIGLVELVRGFVELYFSGPDVVRDYDVTLGLV